MRFLPRTGVCSLLETNSATRRAAHCDLPIHTSIRPCQPIFTTICALELYYSSLLIYILRKLIFNMSRAIDDLPVDQWEPEDWTPADWITAESSNTETSHETSPPHDEADDGQPWQPWYVVLLPSLAFAGVQLSWGVQVGRTSPHLREMGLSDRLIGLAWLAGPVSGIVVQPIVGVLSDRCTSKFGRRRPFMVVGTILIILSLLLFAFSGDIAGLLGDPVSATGNGSRTGLFVALAGFWILDFCINMLQSPCRAIIADIVPEEQVAQGNAYFAFANGFGKTIAYLLGSFARDIRVVNGIAAGFMVVFALIPSLVLNVDRPFEFSLSDESEAEENAERAEGKGVWDRLARTFSEVGVALRGMPNGFRNVMIVQAFLFVSFMLTFIYISIYFGQLNGGNANAALGSLAKQRFEEGVMLANKALVLMSIISMVVAPLIPVFIRLMGTRVYWGGTNLVVGIALICLLLKPGKIAAVIITASVGITLSNAMSIPWSITALGLNSGLEKQRGLFFAVFNLSQAVPGLFSSFLGSLIVHVTNGNLTAPLVLAGIASVLAAFATIWITVPKQLGRGGIVEEMQDLTVM